ncbi:Myosin-VIIa [Hondaea fermentalgiana]|uniref:Myosin-VIIa n=1 Tax=Hondaea fermentalgiana TaxID=2315210 RepID=A0A2R5G9D7_9STRA|nr:Myosin-VIIa [Hondaea fermentalgiana]|eukprot:GBG24681.1 Myosin-VIIa [Hondaea fermentalgiana]
MPLPFKEGDLVWFAHKEDGFRPGVVSTIHDDDCLDALQRRLEEMHAGRRHVHDMSTLPELNDATILENLRAGFTRDLIYTNIGPTLVAVNPYKPVHCTMNERAPGILRTVREIYDEMLRNKSSHSCVVTGESGAGKSESTRLFVNHLATLSVRQSSRFLNRDTSSQQYVLQERIVQAAPILESFGNAKTVRNDNSSRFGKWIEIEIDYATGQPLSANIRNYLLEKSRIVKLGSDERNFHIFYQLLADENLRQAFGLPSDDPATYRLLRGPEESITATCELDDAASLAQLQSAMTTMGMTSEEITYVFRSIAAILRLGDLEVNDALNPDDATEDNLPCKFSPASLDSLQWAATAFGLDVQALLRALTMRAISSGGGRDQIFKARDPAEVRTCTNAFIKSVYSAIFEWITERINVSLDGIADVIEEETCADDDFSRLIESGTIGILDAFGFEIFATNSFEQLCINYCNEKMQLHFNRLVFEEEVQLYVREGILDELETEAFSESSASGIDDCIKLLEGGRGRGIFALIDDELKVPNGSDQGLLRKMLGLHANHPKFSQPALPRGAGGKSARTAGQSSKRADASCSDLFTINHYAGPVTYSISGFLEKSSDPIPLELQLLCAESSNEYFRASFPSQEEVLQLSRGRRAKTTLGTQFKEQLSYLSTLIFDESTPHFIRCIKPNDLASSSQWNGRRVLEQIRYAGLLEASQVRAKGFPVQYVHADFMRCFGGLFLEKEKRRASRDALKVIVAAKSTKREEEPDEQEEREGGSNDVPDLREPCEQLCTDLLARGLLEEDDVRVGLTRVFFRDVSSIRLERARIEVQREAATLLQALARAYTCRVRFARFRDSIVKIQVDLEAASSLLEVDAVSKQLEELREKPAPSERFSVTLEDLLRKAEAFAESHGHQSQLEGALKGADVSLLRACAVECAEAGVCDDLVGEARRILDCYEALDDLLAQLHSFSRLARPKTAQESLSQRDQIQKAKSLVRAIRGANAMPESNFIRQLDVECKLAKAEGVVLDAESFGASLVVATFFRHVTSRARTRQRFRDIAATRKSLEAALDRRNEREIDDALNAMAKLDCGEHAAYPHPLVKEAVAIRADLHITKLAALNQLERLTRKLERRIRHRERQLQAELIADTTETVSTPAAPRKLTPKQQRQQQRQQKQQQKQLRKQKQEQLPTLAKSNAIRPNETKKSRRIRGFRLLRSMPALFHAPYGKKSQVRTSERELLMQAVEKARAAGATEESHAQMREALALAQRLDVLKQRRTSIRLFSSHSLMSLTSASPCMSSATLDDEDLGLGDGHEEDTPQPSSTAATREAGTEAKGKHDSRTEPGKREHVTGDESASLRRLTRLKALRDEEASLLQTLLGQDDPNLGIRIADASYPPYVPPAPEQTLLSSDDPEDVSDGETCITLDQSGPVEELGELGGQDFGIHILVEDSDSCDGSTSQLHSLAAKVNTQLRRKISVKALKSLLPRKLSMTSAAAAEDDDDVSGKVNDAATNFQGPPTPQSGKRSMTKVRSATKEELAQHHAKDQDEKKRVAGGKAQDQGRMSSTANDGGTFALPELASSAERAILERICREREMRKVIQSRCWEARRGITGPLAMAAMQDARRPGTGGPGLGGNANAGARGSEFSFSSMYSSASAALPLTSPPPADHPSFRSETSDRTIPELARRKRAIEQRQLEKKQFLQRHLQGMQVAEDGSLSSLSASNSMSSSRNSSAVSRKSTKAYTEHWEAVAYVAKNVVSSKNF